MAGVRVWDFETQQSKTVSEQDAESGIASGKYGIRSGVEIPVVSPDGRKGTIPSDSAAEAFSKGYRYERPEEVRETFETAEQKSRAAVAKDMEGTAFLSGALKTATFGASDAIAAASGVEREFAQAVQEENPFAYGAGEVTGAIAGSFLTPGRAVTAGATKLGETAAARYGLSPALQKGIEYGAEGLAYGVGEAISDLSLGNPDEVASDVILGGGIGGVFGVAGAKLAPVAKAVKDKFLDVAETAVKSTSKPLEALAKTRAKQMGVEGADELISSGRFKETLDPDNISSMQDLADDMGTQVKNYKGELVLLKKDLRQWKKGYIKNVKEDLDKLPAQQKAAFQKQFAALDSLEKKSAKESAQLLGELNNDIETIATNVFAEADDFVAQSASKLTGITDSQYKKINDFYAAARQQADIMMRGDTPYATTAGKRLADALESIEAEAMTMGAPQAGFHVQKIWGLKRELAKDIEWSNLKDPTDKALANLVGSAGSTVKDLGLPQSGVIDLADKLYTQRSILNNLTRGWRKQDVVDLDKTTTKPLLQSTKIIRDIIKDPEAKGQLGLVMQKMGDFFSLLEPDAKAQELIAKAGAKAAQVGKAAAEKTAAKEFSKESIARVRAKVRDELSGLKNTASVDEITGLIVTMAKESQIKDTAQRALKLKKAQEFLSVNRNLNPVEQYAHYMKVLGDKSSAENIQKVLQFQKDASIMNQLEGGKPGALSNLAILGAGLGSGIDAGITAAVVAKAVHLAKSPKAALEAIPVIEKFASTGRNAVDKFSTAFGKALTGKAAARLTTMAGRKEFESRVKDLEDMRDPTKLDEKLSSSLETLAGAPNVQLALMNQTISGVQFLAEKAPKNPLEGKSIIPVPYKPSEAEVLIFNRTFDVVQNPSVILDRIASNDVIPQEIEAFKTVYPGLYEKTKLSMIDKLSELKTPPSYDTMVTLSLVFDMPVEPTLDGSYVTFMQEFIANYPREKVQSNQSMSKLDPETFLTDNQRIAMR